MIKMGRGESKRGARSEIVLSGRYLMVRIVPTSVFRLLSSVFCLRTSDFRLPSSVFQPLLSIIGNDFGN